MADQFFISGRLINNPIRQLHHSEGFIGEKPNLTTLSQAKIRSLEAICKKVRDSWKDSFVFKEESIQNGVTIKGLRPPQSGAVYASLAHWKITNSSATIVMPTGTGKTETMLALTVCQQLERVLVIVPNDALRDQVTNKFLGLGLLKDIGALSKKALYPVVGTIEHGFRTPQDATNYFQNCNVVVATMNVIRGCDEEVQKAIAEACSHLFIDEAHHINAPTWQKFRQLFVKKTILQFTATPFRGDGKHIDGKIIFNYPLHKAQEEEYFKPINFKKVKEYNKHKVDEIIAQTAIEQLNTDLKNRLNHIIMARAANITRAEEIYKIYQRLGSKYNPLLFHSKKKKTEKAKALKELREGKSRIIVCVDMFGEGFDLPELKIAALHDIHKSLAITLQFTGRFTRTKQNIGDATVIANIANIDVEDALKELYAEDADWDRLLRDLSEGATGRREHLSEFFGGFQNAPPELLLQNVLPKMSTVVYKTNCARWAPEKITEIIKESRLFIEPTIHQQQKVVLFVTCEKEPIPWGNIKGIHNTVWDLYLIHWDEDKKLLFINSSNNDSLHYELAKAIAGDDVQIIKGEQVFRTLHGINRLSLTNLGLKNSINRNVSFTMYSGLDILAALSDAQQHNRTKSNVFGRGYENSHTASVGCSYKGRIWSHKIADDIVEWIDWCHQIGAKLADDKVSIENILKYVLKPTEVTERPELVPLTIEWSDELLQRSEEIVEINIGEQVFPIYEVGIELTNFDKTNPLKFKVFTDNKTIEYKMVFRTSQVEYIPTGGETAHILISGKSRLLSDWLKDFPPIIRFEKDAYLQNDLFVENPAGQYPPMDKEKIQILNWTGVNLRKESQTVSKEQDSIQRHVIQELLKREGLNYDILFDDDGSYEAADIVGIKIVENRLIVDLYHCKYSGDSTPGARIEDLYAVCGQAQKSIHWREDLRVLMTHLSLRESSRIKQNLSSRFEHGDLEKLEEISNQLQILTPEFSVTVVQPGLSKAQVNNDQLQLLAATENYLKETFGIKFSVIASA